MFGSKTRRIRDLQEQRDAIGERLQAALGDVETWRRNYGRLQRGNEALESANAALRSMVGALRERDRAPVEPPPAEAGDEPVERDLTGAAVRPKGQPLDLADELQRARDHAAALEQRLALFQDASEAEYAELAARSGTVPSPSTADLAEPAA